MEENENLLFEGTTEEETRESSYFDVVYFNTIIPQKRILIIQNQYILIKNKEKTQFKSRLDDLIGYTRDDLTFTLFIYSLSNLNILTQCLARPDYNKYTLQKRTCKFEMEDKKKGDELNQLLDQILLSLYPQKPKEVMIILNPFGGPIFEQAGIILTEFETEYKHHAIEIAKTWVPKSNNIGIVAIGGDGLIFEIIQGLKSREDNETFPLGIIPAGSQNALSVSTTGTDDPEIQAVNIVKGFQQKIDILKIYHQALNKDIFSAVFCAYGYLGAVTAESERFRELGPFRYIYCGAKEAVFQRKFYNINLQYLEESNQDLENEENNDDEIWKEKNIDFEIFCVMICNISCNNSQFASLIPDAKCNDGFLNVLIWKKCSTLEMLKYLHQQGKGTHENLDFVEIIKTKKLKFLPLDLEENQSPIDIDGEIYPSNSLLEFSVLKEELTLFGKM